MYVEHTMIIITQQVHYLGYVQYCNHLMLIMNLILGIKNRVIEYKN